MLRRKTAPEGVAVTDLPADVRILKFGLAIDDFVLKVEKWLERWRWSIWTRSDVSFNGEARTPAECIQRGINAVAKARQIGAEPW